MPLSRQNELLKMLLKDCQLNGKQLEYTLRKPFDMLVKNPIAKSWPNLILNIRNIFMFTLSL